MKRPNWGRLKVNRASPRLAQPCRARPGLAAPRRATSELFPFINYETPELGTAEGKPCLSAPRRALPRLAMPCPALPRLATSDLFPFINYETPELGTMGPQANHHSASREPVEQLVRIDLVILDE
jgi:hypothetical protein